jgi:hypothetical protein
VVKFITFIYCLLLIQIGFGQEIKPSFVIGEKLNYDIYYNWGVIWIKAGICSSSVSTKALGNSQVYWFELNGNSLKNRDWIYKFSNHIQCYSDMKNLTPYWAENALINDSKESFENYIIDHNKGKIYSVTKTNQSPIKKDTIKFSSIFFDFAGASFYFRSINYNKFKNNEKIQFSVICDNVIYPLSVKYIGKEQIKLHTGKLYNCLKLTLEVIKGDVFNGGEAVTIWITNDESHTPVLFEAKVLVGSVKAYLVNDISNKIVTAAKN